MKGIVKVNLKTLALATKYLGRIQKDRHTHIYSIGYTFVREIVAILTKHPLFPPPLSLFKKLSL